MAKQIRLAVGDKVAYSVQFLKSIGMSHSDMTRGRGVVRELSTHGLSFTLASIEWANNAELPAKVNVCNLAKAGPNSRFCNVD